MTKTFWCVMISLMIIPVAATIVWKVVVYNECRPEHSMLYCLALVSK